MAELNSLSLKNDANLVAYWRMEGNSNDSKGSANGTDTAITYSLANGKYTQGALFNGSTSKILFGSKVTPLGAKTISFWFKTTQNPATAGTIHSNSLYDGSEYGTLVLMKPAGKIGALLVDGGTGAAYNIETPSAVNDGNWHHFCHTWDGTTGANKAIIYIDGVSVVTGTSNAAETNTQSSNLKFGTDTATPVRFGYAGSLDDYAIFSRALTASEVLTLYREQSSSGFFALVGGL